jgi:hypothetical protein
MFQGKLNKKQYFEGWYFKFLSFDKKHSIALIPGVSLNQNDSHAFIQVFITNHEKKTIKTYYIRYDIHSFIYSHDSFYIKIDKNEFSLDKINLNINQDDLSLTGCLSMDHHSQLKSTLYQPNIMGPFAYMPFMECYHGIVSMDSNVLGKLNYKQTEINFSQTNAYIEKDYGKSFPKKYIWLQSNHFNTKKSSIMFSYASIPFLGLNFKGLIVNVYVQGKHHIFSTYNFSKIVYKEIKDNFVHFIIKKRAYRLEIKAHQQDSVHLKSPHQGEMINEIKEGLSGYIEVKLSCDKEILLEDIGYFAGIEIMF